MLFLVRNGITYVFINVYYCYANGISSVNEVSFKVCGFAVVMALNVTLLWPLQDLRDVRRDTIAGRTTFPVVYGLENRSK